MASPNDTAIPLGPDPITMTRKSDGDDDADDDSETDDAIFR